MPAIPAPMMMTSYGPLRRAAVSGAFGCCAYGPFTATVYGDLDDLLRAGTIERETRLSRTYARWRLTAVGRTLVGAAAHAVGSEGVERLRRAKAEVVFRGFRSLLQHVYQRYPEYGEESIARIGR